MLLLGVQKKQLVLIGIMPKLIVEPSLLHRLVEVQCETHVVSEHTASWRCAFTNSSMSKLRPLQLIVVSCGRDNSRHEQMLISGI